MRGKEGKVGAISSSAGQIECQGTCTRPVIYRSPMPCYAFVIIGRVELFACFFVACLLNVSATRYPMSGTDLFRQLYVLPL